MVRRKIREARYDVRPGFGPAGPSSLTRLPFGAGAARSSVGWVRYRLTRTGGRRFDTLPPMEKLLAFVISISAALAAAQTPTRVTPMTPDVIDKYEQTLASADFIRRAAMVPMRDGVKLYTVLVMKKGTTNAPILLSRSPYDAHRSAHRTASQRVVDILRGDGRRVRRRQLHPRLPGHPRPASFGGAVRVEPSASSAR